MTSSTMSMLLPGHAAARWLDENAVLILLELSRVPDLIKDFDSMLFADAVEFRDVS